MKVTFQIEGGSPVQIECNAGENLLELARRANVAIDAPCSDNGSCGKCRVKLLEGEVFKGETDMLIWVSDDDNRLPVYFEAPLLVGTARGRMSTYTGLKYPFTALITR